LRVAAGSAVLNGNRCQRQGEQQSQSSYFFMKGLSRIRFVQLIRGAVALDYADSKPERIDL
jgi:hypothetical protein